MDSANQSAEEDILLSRLEIAIKLSIYSDKNNWPELLQDTLRKL
jgi:hypothetical protein